MTKTLEDVIGCAATGRQEGHLVRCALAVHDDGSHVTEDGRQFDAAAQSPLPDLKPTVLPFTVTTVAGTTITVDQRFGWVEVNGERLPVLDALDLSCALARGVRLVAR